MNEQENFQPLEQQHSEDHKSQESAKKDACCVATCEEIREAVESLESHPGVTKAGLKQQILSKINEVKKKKETN